MGPTTMVITTWPGLQTHDHAISTRLASSFSTTYNSTTLSNNHWHSALINAYSHKNPSLFEFVANIKKRIEFFFQSRWWWRLCQANRFTDVGCHLGVWLNLTLRRMDEETSVTSLSCSYLKPPLIASQLFILHSSLTHWPVSCVCSRWDFRAIHQNSFMPGGSFFFPPPCWFTASRISTGQFFLFLASRTAVI